MHAFALAALFAAVLAAHEQNGPPGAPPASSAAGPLKPSGATESSPAATHDVRAGVDALLGTREAISPEQWRKLGPAALPVLEEIVGDPKALSTRRARALEGMVALRSPRAPALLSRLAQSDSEPFLIRLAAMRGAGRALTPARQVVALRPALEKATDVRLRAAAAEVLSHHRAGCAAVRDQVKREAAEAGEHFEPALRRCGSR